MDLINAACYIYPQICIVYALILSTYGNTFYAIYIRIADLHRGYGSRISAYGNVHFVCKVVVKTIWIY